MFMLGQMVSRVITYTAAVIYFIYAYTTIKIVLANSDTVYRLHRSEISLNL